MSAGVVFTELDLDFSKFEKNQQKLLSSAKEASTSVEKNWQNLGAKSDNIFNAMRASAENSYNMIKNHAGSSTAEIARAHEVMNTKIASANKEQYGSSMLSIDNLKTHWMAATAAIAGAWMAASKVMNMIDKAADLEEMTGAVDKLAAKYGTTAGGLASNIQAAGQGMIGFTVATRTAGEAMLKGFDPATLTQFASAAKTLSDFSGEKVSDVYEKLVTSITTGREKAIKNLVGIMELENRYTKEQIEGMTALEKAHAKANMVFEKTAEIQKTLGEQVETAADKIEKAKIKMEGYERTAGQYLLESAKAAEGIFSKVANWSEARGIELYDKIAGVKKEWEAATDFLNQGKTTGKTEAEIIAANPMYADAEKRYQIDEKRRQENAKELADTIKANQKINDMAAVGSANWQKQQEKVIASTQEMLKVYEIYYGTQAPAYLRMESELNNQILQLEDIKLRKKFEQNLVNMGLVTQAELDSFNKMTTTTLKLTEERNKQIADLMTVSDKAQYDQRIALETKFLGEVKDLTVAAQTEIAAIKKKLNDEVAAQMVSSTKAAAQEAVAEVKGTWSTIGGVTQWAGGISSGWKTVFDNPIAQLKDDYTGDTSTSTSSGGTSQDMGAAVMLKMISQMKSSFFNPAGFKKEIDAISAKQDEEEKAKKEKEAAARAAEEARLEAIAKQRATMEITLMALQGNATGALAAQRTAELNAMDASLRGLQQEIYSLQDAQKHRTLEIELMELQGDATGALAAKREDELKALDASLQPLQKLIYLTEDWNTQMKEASGAALTEIDKLISASRTASQNARQAADDYRSIIVSLTDEQTKIHGGGTAGAQGRVDTIFGKAMTGDQTSLSALPGAMDSLLESSLKTSKTAEDYARDQGKSLIQLELAKTISLGMINWEEYQATLLEAQTGVLEQIKEELAKADPNLETLQKQAGLLETIGGLLTQQTVQIVDGNAGQILLMHNQNGLITQANVLTTSQTGEITMGNSLLTGINTGIKITDAPVISGYLDTVEKSLAGNNSAEAETSRTALETIRKTTADGLISVEEAASTKAAVFALQTSTAGLLADQILADKTVTDAEVLRAADAVKSTAAISTLLAGGIDMNKALEIQKYLNTIESGLADNNSAEAVLARSAMETIRATTEIADGLLTDEQAKAVKDAMEALQGATGKTLSDVVGASGDIKSDAITQAAAALTAAQGLDPLTGLGLQTATIKDGNIKISDVSGTIVSTNALLTDPVTGKISIGNTLVGGLNTTVLTGNATGDAAKKIAETNKGFTKGMLDELIEAGSYQNGNIANIAAQTLATVAALNRLIDVMATTQAASELAGLQKIWDENWVKYKTAYDSYTSQMDVETAKITYMQGLLAAELASANPEHLDEYRKIIADTQILLDQYTALRNLLTNPGPRPTTTEDIYAQLLLAYNKAYEGYTAQITAEAAVANGWSAKYVVEMNKAYPDEDLLKSYMSFYTAAKELVDTFKSLRDALIKPTPPAGFVAEGSIAGGEYTAPSTIVSNKNSTELSNNVILLDEVRQLRAEMKASQYIIAKNTGKLVTTSDRWDGDGLPNFRTV